MREPTIAEERLARIIAQYHGSQVIYRSRDGRVVTVAISRGDSPFAERSTYVHDHWREYVGAARAMIEHTGMREGYFE